MSLEDIQKELRQSQRRSSRGTGSANVGRDGKTARLAIGADHGGFVLKRLLIADLEERGYDVIDCGTHDSRPVDYPDIAVQVAAQVAEGHCEAAIMIDGAGIGSCMAANKVPGIRAANCHDEATVRNSREHNDANVLVLGSNVVHPGYAKRLVRLWLSTSHAGGRHARRVGKIKALDRGSTGDQSPR